MPETCARIRSSSKHFGNHSSGEVASVLSCRPNFGSYSGDVRPRQGTEKSAISARRKQLHKRDGIRYYFGNLSAPDLAIEVTIVIVIAKCLIAR